MPQWVIWNVQANNWNLPSVGVTCNILNSVYNKYAIKCHLNTSLSAIMLHIAIFKITTCLVAQAITRNIALTLSRYKRLVDMQVSEISFISNHQKFFFKNLGFLQYPCPTDATPPVQRPAFLASHLFCGKQTAELFHTCQMLITTVFINVGFVFLEINVIGWFPNFCL